MAKYFYSIKQIIEWKYFCHAKNENFSLLCNVRWCWKLSHRTDIQLSSTSNCLLFNSFYILRYIIKHRFLLIQRIQHQLLLFLHFHTNTWLCVCQLCDFRLREQQQKWIRGWLLPDLQEACSHANNALQHMQ